VIVLATSYHDAKSVIATTGGALNGAPFFDRVIGIGPSRIDVVAYGALSYHVRGNGDRPLEVRNILTVEGTILIYCPDGTSRAPAFALAILAREALKEAAQKGVVDVHVAADVAVECAITNCSHGAVPHAGIVALTDDQLGYNGALVAAVRNKWY